jgi:hypothetical protein
MKKLDHRVLTKMKKKFFTEKRILELIEDINQNVVSNMLKKMLLYEYNYCF